MSEALPYSPSQPRFSEEEQKRFRESFALSAQKYRSSSRLALVIVGISFAIILTWFLLPKIYAGWIIGAFVICWLALIVIAISHSELQCPACHGNLVSRELGSYCPECGAVGLKPGGWIMSAHCDSCGKTLRRGKTRRYRIRACTHCGLMLDERGL